MSKSLALVLGLNVWVSLTLIPGIETQAIRSPLTWCISLLPLIFLIYGLLKEHSFSCLTLFPITLLFPFALNPTGFQATLASHARLGIVTLSIVAYLFVISSLLSSSFFKQKTLNAETIPLSTHSTKQRFARIHRMLTCFAFAIPILLLIQINASPTIERQLQEFYPERSQSMKILLSLGLLCAWSVVFTFVFNNFLQEHRRGLLKAKAFIATLKQNKQRHALRIGLRIFAISAMLGLSLWLR